MIVVQEIIPKKLSGLTSFYIFADHFIPEFQEVFNKLTIYYYFKKEHAWEISSVDLKLFLDLVTVLDDVQLKLLETNALNQVLPVSDQEQTLLIKNNYKPFSHQIDAVNFTLQHHKWLLLDSMGLGKSGSIIYSAEILHRRGLIDHCLIICGVNAVKENWANEIEKFSDETYTILGKKIGKQGGISYAPIAERAKILKEPIKEFFVITNIETIRNDSIVKAIQNSKNDFGMIAVDEIHRCSNKKSGQGGNLLKLDADYKIAATGTLITNSPISAYLPLVWTENDHSILTTFKPQYFVYGGYNDAQVIGYKNLDVLQEEIEACSLRRTLDQVRSDMPSKTVSYEILELDKSHLDFYKAVKAGVKEEADKVELNALNLLALTTRLRQAAVCPNILTTQPIKSTKLLRCKEIVDDLVASGEKVVILSNFVQSVKDLAELLAEYNPLLCLGEMKDEIVAFNNNLFQENPDYKVIIGTHARMGTGLTFNAAQYLIMLDIPYTYAALAQSEDRIYRVNNTKPAYIKILEAKDTIDERIHQIVDTKKDLEDYIVDGKTNSLSTELTAELKQIIAEL